MISAERIARSSSDGASQRPRKRTNYITAENEIVFCSFIIGGRSRQTFVFNLKNHLSIFFFESTKILIVNTNILLSIDEGAKIERYSDNGSLYASYEILDEEEEPKQTQ